MSFAKSEKKLSKKCGGFGVYLQFCSNSILFNFVIIKNQKKKKRKISQPFSERQKPVYYSLPIHRDEHPFSIIKREFNIQKMFHYCFVDSQRKPALRIISLICVKIDHQKSKEKRFGSTSG